MKRAFSQLFPIVFGLLVVGAGAYVGWIFYQAGQGDLVDVEVKQVDFELNLRESLVDALLDVVLNQELDLELDPEVRAEIVIDNPSIFAVRIHDIDGDLTVEGMELGYVISGLEADEILASGDSLTFYISIEPSLNETLRIARGNSDDGYQLTFDGEAVFSIFGVEQTVPIEIEETVESGG